jgi:hypothetical protein
MMDLIGWIIGALGYLGVALLTLAETVFPPLPSEVIIPLAGMEAQRRGLSLTGVILAAGRGLDDRQFPVVRAGLAFGPGAVQAAGGPLWPLAYRGMARH